jgi:hypothetical protein
VRGECHDRLCGNRSRWLRYALKQPTEFLFDLRGVSVLPDFVGLYGFMGFRKMVEAGLRPRQ